MTRDEAIALFSYLRLAHDSRVSLAETMAGELQRARDGLRKAESAPPCRNAALAAKHLAWSKERVADLESWIASYASMRGEHPDARLPPLKDKTRRCEPQIAEIAARLQDAVERAAWDVLNGREEETGT